MPSVKFDVDVSSFKNGISSAKSEVKTLDQQMKMIDATFKATGNSEQALAQKTQTLNSRMTAQKTIADQAKQALDARENCARVISKASVMGMVCRPARLLLTPPRTPIIKNKRPAMTQ